MKQSTIIATLALFFAGFAIAAPAPVPINTSNAINAQDGLQFIEKQFTNFNELAAHTKMMIRGYKKDAVKNHLNADDTKKLDELLEEVERWNQYGDETWKSATSNIENNGDINSIVTLVQKTFENLSEEISRIRGLELGGIVASAHMRAEREKLLAGKKGGK